MQHVSCSAYRCQLASGLLFKSQPQTAWPKCPWRQQLVWPIYKLLQRPMMAWMLDTHVSTAWKEPSWPARRGKPKNLKRLKKITKPLNQNTPEDAKTDNRSMVSSDDCKFHKTQGISWWSERLSACAGLFSMNLVRHRREQNKEYGRHTGGEEVELHSFLTPTVNCRDPPRKERRNPRNCGAHSRQRRVEKNPAPSP